MKGSSCLVDHNDGIDFWFKTFIDLIDLAGNDFKMLLLFIVFVNSMASNGIDSRAFMYFKKDISGYDFWRKLKFELFILGFILIKLKILKKY